MSEILATLANLSVLVFVITSMLSMGLSLTIKQIIDPLRSARLVILALLANFVLVPALAWILIRIFNLDGGLGIGLLLIATAAGAPFLPKLAQVARGDVAFSVGLMVLLMIVTIVYMPIVLPLLLQGVSVNPLDIARSLVVLMLIPLAAGLFIKARYESAAESLRPTMAQASNYSIILLIVLGLVLNINAVVDLIGTGTLLAIAVFLIIALVVGYLLGGPGSESKSVLGLGTAQRNLSAALVVGAQNFADDPDVIVMILVAGMLGLVLLMLVGGELGKRAPQTGPPAVGPVE